MKSIEELGAFRDVKLYSSETEFPVGDEVEAWIIGNNGNGYPDGSYCETMRVVTRNTDGTFDYHVTNDNCTRHIGRYSNTEEGLSALLRDVIIGGYQAISLECDKTSNPSKIYLQYPDGYQTIEGCWSTPDKTRDFHFTNTEKRHHTPLAVYHVCKGGEIPFEVLGAEIDEDGELHWVTLATKIATREDAEVFVEKHHHNPPLGRVMVGYFVSGGVRGE